MWLSSSQYLTFINQRATPFAVVKYRGETWSIVLRMVPEHFLAIRHDLSKKFSEICIQIHTRSQDRGGVL